jgi:hypothetical protein
MEVMMNPHVQVGATDAGGIVFIVALFAWLAWSRYLHHKEVLLLQERGGDWQALVAMRERWRIRWGILAGTIVLFVGGGILIMGRVIGRTDAVGGDVVGILGGFIAAAGLAVLVAHIIWGRGQAAAIVSSRTEDKS